MQCLSKHRRWPAVQYQPPPTTGLVDTGLLAIYLGCLAQPVTAVDLWDWALQYYGDEGPLQVVK